jgi:phospholipid transport system substrate-binding protein
MDSTCIFAAVSTTPRNDRKPLPLGLALAFRLALLAAVVTAVPLPSRAEGEDAGPIPTIEKLHATLLEVMKGASTLGYEGRRKLLEPTLDRTMNLPFMAEKAAGKYWKDFSEPDRARWVTAFRGNTIANYAGRFDGFSGQSFVTNGDEESPFDTRLVKTTLKDPTGEDVQLNYRMKKGAEGWRIIDIYMHGTVSELALRRAEYSSALERDGLDKVIENLQGQAAKLAGSRDSEASEQ